jgi:hypothetical protein
LDSTAKSKFLKWKKIGRLYEGRAQI